MGIWTHRRLSKILVVTIHLRTSVKYIHTHVNTPAWLKVVKSGTHTGLQSHTIDLSIVAKGATFKTVI